MGVAAHQGAGKEALRRGASSVTLYHSYQPAEAGGAVSDNRAHGLLGGPPEDNTRGRGNA
jgi:hypothetical protein